jgi:hypothetical protein
VGNRWPWIKASMQSVSCLSPFHHMLMRVFCSSFNPALASRDFYKCGSLKNRRKWELLSSLLELNLCITGTTVLVCVPVMWKTGGSPLFQVVVDTYMNIWGLCCYVMWCCADNWIIDSRCFKSWCVQEYTPRWDHYFISKFQKPITQWHSYTVAKA